MIAFLHGEVSALTDDAIILEVNGVGFQILLPLSSLQQIRAGERLLIYTYLSHKEDSMLLFGFLNKEEKSLFTKLITVSGIGPKTALAILSTLSVEQFCQAIIAEDTKKLSSAPGIGLKTAQRLILELKTKIQKEVETSSIVLESKDFSVQPLDDAVAALLALGYQEMVALKAVNQIRASNPELNLQDLIKESLKLLMK